MGQLIELIMVIVGLIVACQITVSGWCMRMRKMVPYVFDWTVESVTKCVVHVL